MILNLVFMYIVLIIVEIISIWSPMTGRICGLLLIVVWNISMYRINEKIHNKRLAKLKEQLINIECPDDMEILDVIAEYGNKLKKKHQVDYAVSMLIKTNRTLNEIYSHFNNFSYKSVNKVFKSEPSIRVQRIDEVTECCGDEFFDESHVIGTRKAVSGYYTVLLMDRSIERW